MADYLAGLAEGPVWRSVPPEEASVLAEQAIPEEGVPFAELLDFASEHVLPYPFGNGHPRFFGWATPRPRPRASSPSSSPPP